MIGLKPSCTSFRTRGNVKDTLPLDKAPLVFVTLLYGGAGECASSESPKA